MSATRVSRIVRAFRPSVLTGPILGKELRVSSRRRRTYLLRFGYLALLTFVVLLVWWGTVRGGSGPVSARRVARLSEAGKIIVSSIVWFQFIACQLVVIALMSTSISDEIQHTTLGTLMSTPINSFQIVVGKLFSKLLQLMILLGISLPLLAVVRVFGGVPWDFVVSGVCITLSTAVFLGAIGMYFSIFNRRAYAAMIKTILAGAALFGLIPLLIILSFRNINPPMWLGEWLGTTLMHSNPYLILGICTKTMVSSRMPGGVAFFSWPVHCGALLAASALVLTLCVAAVRKVALRQATGEAGLFVSRRRRRKAAARAVAAAPTRRIRRITGSPVVWRELRAPTFGRRSASSVVWPILGVVALLIVYVAVGDDLDDDDVQITFVLILTLLGMLMTAVVSATGITAEKETRSWPILLSTTLSDRRIILGKAVGVWRRCLPAWVLLGIHVAVFTCMGHLHPVLIWHLSIVVTWVILFLTGTGLYFSARLKRTTAAVLANVTLAAVLWVIIPLLSVIIVEGGRIRQGRRLVEDSLAGNPGCQVVVVAQGAYKSQRRSRRPDRGWSYRWPGNKWHSVSATTYVLLVNLLGYGSASCLFLWRARRRLRRRVF